MVWMAVIGIIQQILGSIGEAAGMYEQGKTQAKLFSYNEMLMAQNAKLAKEQISLAERAKALEESKYRNQSEKILASQRAAFGKAGVTMAGTPTLVQASTMVESELDALAIRYASTVEEARILAQKAGYQQQKSLYNIESRQAMVAGQINAGSSLLTGIGKAVDSISKMYGSSSTPTSGGGSPPPDYEFSWSS